MTVTKFEVGKDYRTRDGKKATVLLIRPTYMVGEIEGDRNPYTWNRGGGWHPEAVPYSCDLVADWREPERVMTKMYRHSATGVIRVHSEFMPDCGWELIAQHELVEGEGMRCAE